MKTDPTRQAGNRRRAIADLKRRNAGVQKQVLEIFNAIPYEKQTITTNAVNYVYELSAQRVSEIDAFIRDIVNGWFETGDPTKPPRFFFDQYDGAAFRSGTIESANRIQLLATQAGYPELTTSQLQVENILMSEPYRDRLELIYGRTFNEMKGFSGQTSADLSRVLSDVMALGKSPRVAQKEIRKRFDVANSRAERIARTEINNAYTTAKLSEMKSARDDLGINTMVIQRSALVPTTRWWHANRHGKMYTIEQQNEWWAEGANKIMCLCSVSEAVLDSYGVPYDMGLIKRLTKEREAFIPN